MYCQRGRRGPKPESRQQDTGSLLPSEGSTCRKFQKDVRNPFLSIRKSRILRTRHRRTGRAECVGESPPEKKGWKTFHTVSQAKLIDDLIDLTFVKDCQGKERERRGAGTKSGL